MKNFLLAFFSVLVLSATALHAGQPELFVRGDYNEWGANNDAKMTMDNGIYTKTMDSFTGKFKIANAAWDANFNFGAQQETNIVAGEPITLVADNNSRNLNVPVSLTDVTFSFDISTKVLTVTGTAGEIITVTYVFNNPETYTPSTPFEWTRGSSSSDKVNDYADIMGNPLKASEGILLEGCNDDTAGASSTTKLYRQNSYASADAEELVENPWAKAQIRSYASGGGYLTFTTLPGYVIKSIEFTPNGSGYQNDLEETIAGGASALGTFTTGSGSNPSVWSLKNGAEAPTFLKFTVKSSGKKQVRINAIKVVMLKTEMPFVEEPLYLTGAFNNWTTGDANWKFTTEDNEIYTIEGKTIDEGKEFKITGSDWNAPSYSTSNLAMLLKTYNCPEAAGDNTNMKFVGKVENLKVVFNKTEKTVAFTGNITLPVQDMPESLFIIGTVDGHEWAPGNGVEMTKTGNAYTADINVTGATADAPRAFSFVQELKLTWDQLNSYNNRIAPTSDTELTPETPGSFEFFEDGNYAKAFLITTDGNYKVTADFSTMKASIEIIPDWTEEPLYLTGSFNNWTPGDENWKLTTTDNVTYSLEGKDFSEGAEFKITGASWDENPGYTTQNLKMEMDTEYDCDAIDNGNNMGFNGSATGVSVTFNKETKKVTFTGTLTHPTPPATPETLNVIGEVNGNSWAPETGVAMTKDGQKFTAIITITDAPKYFSFAVTLAESWNILNIAGNRFAPEADTEIAPGTSGIFAPAGASAKSFFITTDGTYKLTADFENMTASVVEDSGIKDLIEDDVNAEWYTLQGVRVSKPEKGNVYIRVIDGKAVKIAK